jgi:microsomal dipeptidase-like Zn-dependent dipeptidase
LSTLLALTTLVSAVISTALICAFQIIIKKKIFNSWFVRRVPTGLSDVSFFPDLFALLAEDTAWTVENLRKLAGENLIRVFADVETVFIYSGEGSMK